MQVTSTEPKQYRVYAKGEVGGNGAVLQVHTLHKVEVFVPHPNIQHQTNGNQVGEHGGTAVT